MVSEVECPKPRLKQLYKQKGIELALSSDTDIEGQSSKRNAWKKEEYPGSVIHAARMEMYKTLSTCQHLQLQD
jgi:hypothetical protein